MSGADVLVGHDRDDIEELVGHDGRVRRHQRRGNLRSRTRRRDAPRVCAGATVGPQAGDLPTSAISLRGVTKRFGTCRRGRRRVTRHRRRRVLLAARPVGLGQDDDAADDRGLRAADDGRDPARRRRCHRPTPVRPRREHRVPGLRAVPAHDGRAERRVRRCASGGSRSPSARARAEAALATVRLDRVRGPQAEPALRRPAPAGRARPRARQPPAVLLLDEPLGALDLKLREEMQVELKQIQRDVGITFVFVTHDQGEALTMSDRVAVFDRGPHRAGRHADRDLRATGQPVRRRLRRYLERPRWQLPRVTLVGMDGAIAVRPEKIRILARDDDGRIPTRCVIGGVVRDVQYHGGGTRSAWCSTPDRSSSSSRRTSPSADASDVLADERCTRSRSRAASCPRTAEPARRGEGVTHEGHIERRSLAVATRAAPRRGRVRQRRSTTTAASNTTGPPSVDRQGRRRRRASSRGPGTPRTARRRRTSTG